MVLTIMGDGSLGCCYRKNIHSSPRRGKYVNESYEEEGIKVSSVKKLCGHRSLDTIKYYSSNCVGSESSGHISQETSHYNSSNCGGRLHRSSLTRHSYSIIADDMLI